MPRYESYKDSGTEWLGDIPRHWIVEKGKWIFKKESRPIQSDDEVITCFRDGQVTLRKNRKTDGFTNALQEIGYQRVCKGDLVIHAMDAFAGAIGVSDSYGKSSPVYSVCTPLKSNSVDPAYYAYLLRDLALSGVIVSLAKGIRERSTDFRFNDFGGLHLSIPPLEEQQEIVAFLNKKTAQIDQAIAIKQRQIALLKERKQILIQNAVTKGLNPDAPMKASGVDWIGDIPAHWEVKPLISETELKFITNCANRELLSVYLDLGVIKFSEIDEKRTNATSLDLSGYQAVDPGDFVLNNQQAWRGSVGVSKYTGIISPAYIVLTLTKKFDIDYANHLLRCGVVVAHYLMASRGVGSIQRNLYWQHIKRVPIFIPPTREQQEIASQISRKCSELDLAINSQHEQIQKLQEYKATLINSAVTGKIKIS